MRSTAHAAMTLCTLVTSLALTDLASAQPVPPTGTEPVVDPTPAPMPEPMKMPMPMPEPDPEPDPVIVAGYVETYYQYAFSRPDSRLVPLRYENRHSTFTLHNAVVDVTGTLGAAHARVAMQTGAVTSLEYSGEPTAAGSDPSLWQHVQQAHAGFGRSGGLTVDAGLFLSPIGPESIASKDDWNWSRSTLFVALPAYHAGVRVTRPLGGHLTGQAWIINGWNDAVDRNRWKSAIVGVSYAKGSTAATVLYNGGIERATGAAEGNAWRHLVDANLTFAVDDKLSLLVHLDVGAEPNDIGTDTWAGAALYAKYQATPSVELTGRVDGITESVPDGASGIFYGIDRVLAATATVGYRPAPNALVRFELRHDNASDEILDDGANQTTATAALAAWF